MAGDQSSAVPFAEHVELLRLFVAGRRAIVERIQALLNAQRRPASFLQDRPALSSLFEDCFYSESTLTDDQRNLRGQLQTAHWDSGFRPRQVSELHNDLIHPAEMMVRGFHFWQQTRWPGRNGRVRYAQTLFNIFLLRCLEFLSLRIWEAEPGGERRGEEGVRLGVVQTLLDELWRSSPADQPAFVRDARWLIPLAQSPTTDGLAAYFDVAERVAENLGEIDRLEVDKAAVMMIGGHLRSQIRHYCSQEDVSIDDRSVVLRTRSSNALDFALLVQGLVPVLEAYEAAGDDQAQRLELAHVICQAISPDPEVFVNRIDLLGAYSMIEHLFIATDGRGAVAYTAMGERHLRLLDEYAARIGRVAQSLCDDCVRFRPEGGAYSPFGAIYGTPSTLTELIAFKVLQPDADLSFGLEDAFSDGSADSGKLAWVSGLRRLPNMDPAVQKLYDYPHRFAVDIFARIERALERHRGSPAGARDVARAGCLYVMSDDGTSGDDSGVASPVSIAPSLPIRYIGSSDSSLVARQAAEAYDHAQLLRDRLEGHFAVSYETAGGWVAISKDIWTAVLGHGRDAKLSLPSVPAQVLKLMGMSLVELGKD